MVRDVRVREPDEEGSRASEACLMAAFVVRRVFWTIPVTFLAVTMIFFLMRAIGGNPFRHGTLLGLATPGGGWTKYGDPQPEAIENNLARRYGLDLPWYEQYVNFLEGVVTFDFGPSLSFRNETVNELIRETAPNSIELGLLALAWAILLGVPAAVFAALRANTALDYGVRLISSIGFAVPNFLLATMLVYLLSVKLGWLPTNGWTSWRHKLLPSLTLAMLPMAYLTRIVRGAMLETLQEEYVRAARAKGLRSSRVVVAHALRNSLIPAVTVAAPLLGFLVTGAFVIETIYSVPGVSRYFVAAVAARDYTFVLAATVLTTIVIVVLNLVADIVYALLDPRVRES
jgi:oligopeptide transport system permease protein